MLKSDAKVALAALAERQWGRVTWGQIAALGVPSGTIALWSRQGYLHLVLPGVYAVGHRAADYKADLAAALLYAGPGAMLSHGTAAHWLGLFNERPRQIHVSTPRRCRSQPGIVVHRERSLDRIWHHRLPTTTVPQVLLDVASGYPLRALRVGLANADYKRILDVTAVEAILGRGRPGSAQLRFALREHQPKLALSKSTLEVILVEICESARFVVPEINADLDGWEIDALWRPERIAVELDGYDNHRSPAQVRRDRRKELHVREVGFTPLRYSEEQLTRHRKAVIADLRRAGAPQPS